jgi:uncharacterized membrane protein
MTAPTQTSAQTTPAQQTSAQPTTAQHPSATSAHYRRILRRETHSSRATLAILLAVVLILVLAWIGTESVLQFFGFQALLAAPTDMVTTIAQLPEAVMPAALTAAGIVVALLGAALLLAAILPGRRARHTAEVGRTAVLVDNAVIASALARAASSRANVDPDQVRVSVGHRTAEVFVRPSSGFPVNQDAVKQAVLRQIEELDLRPSLRCSVVIEKRGVVGA